MSSAAVVEITCARSSGIQRRRPTKAVPGIPSQSGQVGMTKRSVVSVKPER